MYIYIYIFTYIYIYIEREREIEREIARDRGAGRLGRLVLDHGVPGLSESRSLGFYG